MGTMLNQYAWPGHLTTSTLLLVEWTWWCSSGMSVMEKRGSRSQVLCYFCWFIYLNTWMLLNGTFIRMAVYVYGSFAKKMLLPCAHKCFIASTSLLVLLADTHRLHHVSSLAWVDDHTLVTVSHDATVKQWTITYWAAGRHASTPPGTRTTVDVCISFYKQTNSSLSGWCCVSFVNIWIVIRSWLGRRSPQVTPVGVCCK